MIFKKEIKIDNFKIGNLNESFIIAEAGVSHFGSLKKAYKLVDIAVHAKVNAIKFQLFKTENLYSKKESPNWFKRMKSRELSYENYLKLIKYCKKKNILLFSTAHDEESLDFLVKNKQKLFKIGSGEIYNWNFISKIASKKLPVIVSTGMYEVKDIKKIINIFKKNKNNKLIILYCVTSYPTNPSDIDLNYIKVIQKKFKVISGYSDHTKGYHIPLASVARGAKVIEKHISIDFNVKNAQDWKVSLNNEELKSFVQDVREVEDTLKYNKNKLSKIEKSNKKWATKSIIYLNNLKKNHILKDSDLIVKRPAGGIMPFEIKKVIKRKLIKNVLKDSFVKYSDLM